LPFFPELDTGEGRSEFEILTITSLALKYMKYHFRVGAWFLELAKDNPKSGARLHEEDGVMASLVTLGFSTNSCTVAYS